MTSKLSELRWIIEQTTSTLAARVFPLEIHLWTARRRAHFQLHRQGIPAVVRDNVRHTFSNLDEGCITRIARKHIEFSRRLDLHDALSRRLQLGRQWWSLSGRQYLDEALAEGRGVLLVSAHLGHVRLISPALRAYGYEPRLVRLMGLKWSGRSQRWTNVYATANSLKRALISNFLFDPIELQTTIKADIDIRPILAALKGNQPVIILGDGLRSSQFVTLSLLGRPYPFPVGLTKIAEMTGAPILPTFAIEQTPSFHLSVEIQPALPIEPGIPRSSIAKFAAALDEKLRTAPEQWHRWSIWKVFENSIQWTQSMDRWDQSFGKWCQKRGAPSFGAKLHD